MIAARLGSLAEQVADEPRTMFAYLPHPPWAFLKRIEPYECDHFFLSPEPPHIDQQGSAHGRKRQFGHS